MTERKRIQDRVPALLDVIWEGATGRYEARTSDITTAGCFIDSIRQVTVGETITFRIGLRAEDSIEIQAEVVHALLNRFNGLQEETVETVNRDDVAA